MAPLERLGTPDDIAEAVSFLAGPARWINGQVIYANGGIAAYGAALRPDGGRATACAAKTDRSPEPNLLPRDDQCSS